MVTYPDPRKGPVDRTPPTGRLTVTPGQSTAGLGICFRLQGSWRVYAELRWRRSASREADTWRTRSRD